MQSSFGACIPLCASIAVVTGSVSVAASVNYYLWGCRQVQHITLDGILDGLHNHSSVILIENLASDRLKETLCDKFDDEYKFAFFTSFQACLLTLLFLRFYRLL